MWRKRNPISCYEHRVAVGAIYIDNLGNEIAIALDKEVEEKIGFLLHRKT